MSAAWVAKEPATAAKQGWREGGVWSAEVKSVRSRWMTSEGGCWQGAGDTSIASSRRSTCSRGRTMSEGRMTGFNRRGWSAVRMASRAAEDGDDRLARCGRPRWQLSREVKLEAASRTIDGSGIGKGVARSVRMSLNLRHGEGSEMVDAGEEGCQASVWCRAWRVWMEGGSGSRGSGGNGWPQNGWIER